MGSDMRQPRVATVRDAHEVAQLLHDFNVEFGSPTPGVEVLAARLRSLLSGEDTFAILAGRPAFALALVRANGAAMRYAPGNVARFGPQAVHNTANLVRLPHGAGTIHPRVSGLYSSIRPGRDANCEVPAVVNHLPDEISGRGNGW